MIKKPEKNVFANKDLAKASIILVIINIIFILFIILISKLLPPEIPIFYGVSEGDGQLTQTLGLTIPFIVSAIICVVNFLISLIVDNKFIRQMLFTTSVVATIFSLITVLKVILLVGNI